MIKDVIFERRAVSLVGGDVKGWAVRDMFTVEGWRKIGLDKRVLGRRGRGWCVCSVEGNVFGIKK